MKSFNKFINIASCLLLCGMLVYYGYYTFHVYMGFILWFVLPAIFGGVFLVSLLIRHLFFRQHHRFDVFLHTCTIAFIPISLLIYKDLYKPTITFHIPKNYNGHIYIFPTTTGSKTDVYIDTNGIGYILNQRHRGGFLHEVYRGKKDISDIINMSLSKMIPVHSYTPNTYSYLNLLHLQTDENDNYPQREYWENFEFDSVDYARLIRQRIVDSDRVYIQTQKVSTQ